MLASPKRIEVMGCVLVVDDDTFLRRTVAEWLREEGHEVFEASSADEALVVLSSAVEINLVVTDVHMPGSLNGIELTRYIHSGNKHLPVIVMSGQAEECDVKATSAIAFFRKPVNCQQMATLVTSLIH
jgi:DNA-binding NtrC family response regulator